MSELVYAPSGRSAVMETSERVQKTGRTAVPGEFSALLHALLVTPRQEAGETVRDLVSVYLEIKHKGSTRAYEKACREVRGHFSREFSRWGIPKDDVEALIDHLRSYSDPPAILRMLFLYTQTCIDTRNLNDVIRSPQDIIKYKQGECDDVGFFFKYCAERCGFTGGTLLLLKYSSDPTRHVIFCYQQKGTILVLDNNRCFEYPIPFDQQEPSFRRVLYERYPDVGTAFIIGPEWQADSVTREAALSEWVPPQGYDYVRGEHHKVAQKILGSTLFQYKARSKFEKTLRIP